MKQSIFLTTVIVVTALGGLRDLLCSCWAIRRTSRTANSARFLTIFSEPCTRVGSLCPFLICLTLMNLTLVFERIFSLRKANGKRSTHGVSEGQFRAI